ncbi:M48 family metallopeptidase [Helicobacter sp. MIT 14-3879]|uniref:M48 family metallopeptidase n=1 Tax=Helicobacter sp. MIT 14-3879 TaxID=2040649 RepID=UPI000E1F3D7D|nr:M48 family metallopeptidase [Helicobacter sp. MIT 14-3879]RDU65178.1 peptidase M48 [Helicobacter sp. MIT 14-3879]
MIILSAIFIFFYTIPICIIAMLQIGHIKTNNKAVILNEKDFITARNYALINQYFSIVEAIFSGVLFIFWINLGLILLNKIVVFNNIFTAQIVIVVTFLAINTILNLPLESYKTLIIDKSFGFSKINIKLYIIDFIKSFAMLIIFGGLICAGLIYLIDNILNWWIYGFILMLFIVLLANLIYPTIIAPLFNKFTPLNDEELKNSIANLMNKVGFKANGIFIMDASKRDGRLNAYFGGLGKSKRVVLFDTLLSKVSHNELLAILGHELAHFKHKDLIKNIFIIGFVLFVLFFIAGNLPKALFENIPNNASMKICILILISSLISFYFMPLINYFSRKAEYKADEFGSNLTNKTDLGNALVKLINENKAFPYSHKVFTFFYMSHPPLLDRLKALNFNYK